MLTEQTEIAKMLGISHNQFRRMVEGRIEFKLINNKRHYKTEEVFAVIKMAKTQQ